MKNDPTTDISEINLCLPLLQKIRGDAAKNKKWGFDLEPNNFAKAMACLTSQSYGGRIENYFANQLNLERTDDQNRGDRRSILGEYFEMKCSIFNTSNVKLNLVQIRPWQNTGYIFCVFDIRDLNNIQTQLFFLNKNQMELEKTKCKVSSAHGTKITNLNNLHKEEAMRLEADGIIYNRWIVEYGISLERLYSKLNEK